jgi:Tfp pilus assembly protein PilF
VIENWKTLLLLPGLLGLGLILDQTLLASRRASRSPAEELLHWQRHAEANPGFVLAHHRLGISYERARSWKLAQRAFERALEIDPEYTDSAVGLAGALRNRGKRLAAKSFMTDFLARHPDCAPCAFSLATDLFELGEFEDAEATIRRAIAGADAGEQEADMRVLAGRIQMTRGQRQEAARIFAGVLARDPEHPEALLNAGWLNLRDHPANAVDQLTRYRQLVPQDGRGALFLARAHLKNRDFEEARRLLDEADATLLAAGSGALKKTLRTQIENTRAQINEEADAEAAAEAAEGRVESEVGS